MFCVPRLIVSRLREERVSLLEEARQRVMLTVKTTFQYLRLEKKNWVLKENGPK